MAHDPSDQETTLDDAIDVASLEGRRHLTLLVVSGPAAGQWHLVPAQGGVIGRHPECDVMVADPAVSRRQAKVTLRDDGCHWVEDLGSRNGTFLSRGGRSEAQLASGDPSGGRISGERIERAPLEDGDQIQLSSASVLRVRYLGAQETLLVHQLQEAASTDALTGVANRRYLLLRLSQELSYAKRHQAPLCVLMIDLDDLKRVNDDAGRLVGDGILQEIAQHLESAARLEDVVARYGGDEFVAAWYDIDEARFHEIGARLREALCSLDDEAWRAGLPPLTVSGGAVYAWPGQGIDLSDLFAAVDAQLYEAKRAGRNRIAYETIGSAEQAGGEIPRVAADF